MKKGPVSILLLFILCFEAFSVSKCERSATLSAGNLEEQENRLKGKNEAIRKSSGYDYKTNDRLAQVDDLKEVLKAKVVPVYGGADINRPRSTRSAANSNLDKLSSFSVTTRQMLLGLLLPIFFF